MAENFLPRDGWATLCVFIHPFFRLCLSPLTGVTSVARNTWGHIVELFKDELANTYIYLTGPSNPWFYHDWAFPFTKGKKRPKCQREGHSIGQCEESDAPVEYRCSHSPEENHICHLRYIPGSQGLGPDTSSRLFSPPEALRPGDPVGINWESRG